MITPFLFPYWIVLAAALANTSVGEPKAAAPSAPPPLDAYIVEPVSWDELRCFEYDPDTCTQGDPTLRVRFRMVEAIHGSAWTGDRSFELAGDVADYDVETNRTLLVLHAPDQVVAVTSIDPVVGGGWAYCGEPNGFEKDDEALLQPIEFAGVFGDVRLLSEHGRHNWDDDAYVVEGDLLRCKRGVPLRALLRWIDAGGRP